MPINKAESLLNYYISIGNTNLAREEMKIFLKLLDGSMENAKPEAKLSFNAN